MNTSPTDGYLPRPEDRAPIGPGEDTLRLIAGLPAPDGLADRVRSGLDAAPQAGWMAIGRGLFRPPGGWMYSGLVRTLAATAIVCLVVGGGWSLYSHVQPSVKLVVLPSAPVSPGGNGFSSAGARRVPETLQGPVLNHPVAAPPETSVVEKAPAEQKPAPGAAVRKKKASRGPARIHPTP